MDEQTKVFALIFIMAFLGVFPVLQTTRVINGLLWPAYKVNSPFLKKICWLCKDECLLAIPSIVFLSIGYLYLLFSVVYALGCALGAFECRLLVIGVFLCVEVLTALVESMFTMKPDRW